MTVYCHVRVITPPSLRAFYESVTGPSSHSPELVMDVNVLSIAEARPCRHDVTTETDCRTGRVNHHVSRLGLAVRR